MKVLLSHGYFLAEDKAEQKIMMPYPPQGLLHIAAFLEDMGVESKVYDTTFSSFNEFCAYLGETIPKYLGLYANLMTRVNIIKMVRYIRESENLKDIVIILGGPDVTHHAENYLDKGVDYCITGEGEKTFYDLLEGLERDKSISSIKGVSFRDGKETIFTGEPELIEDLEALPFPDFDEIDIEKYFSAWKAKHGYTSLTISTMRGCPYSCRWCSKAVFGKTFRRRPVKQVVDELARLQKKYRPDRFWIVDDVFTISKEWLQDFTNAINERSLQIKYECISRADRMDNGIIGLLAQSGCFRLWIGAESGSQEVLDMMDRKVDAKAVREMIKLTKNAGIEAGTFLMLGYPGETEKHIFETSKHLRDSLPDLFTITMTYPIPGTELYKEAEKTGLKVPGEWGCYTDREIEFTRTYRPRYYRHAIRYLHHSAEGKRASVSGNLPGIVKHGMISGISRVLMVLTK